MTQREMNRLTERERENALRKAANGVNLALNLFGPETVAELMDAAKAGIEDSMLERLLKPDCHDRRGSNCSHSFPAWFCQEAKPEANRFRRTAEQYRRAVEVR